MSIEDSIRATVEEHPIVLYMKGTPSFPQCGFSAAVIESLRRLGRPFHAVNVLTDPAVRAGIKTYSSWPTIPQLYISGQFVGGSDIVRELESSGELQKKVEAAFSG